MSNLKHFDAIANIQEIPRQRLRLVDESYESTLEHLPIGQVGTVLEIVDGDNPQYLIEFADLQGREYAMAVLTANEILALHYELSIAS